MTPADDTRKLCTCDGAGRGPGRNCVVKAGERLGELWRCAQGMGHQPDRPVRFLCDELDARMWSAEQVGTIHPDHEIKP